ncbi:MAG TPA: fibronectin type III domain-containing protein, partial [Pseudonocardiaceae bacterium]
SHNRASTWMANSNGWRVDTDVECYCGTIVTWNNSVKVRWTDVVQWIPNAGPGHWNNLDSLDVGNGTMDGITPTERQSYMTLWAIEAAPLYLGDDLTTVDSYGMSLLTNDEVIAVDQAGNPAKPVSQTSDQQVWSARNPDGSLTVALFNLGGAAATVSANWNELGIGGVAGVRDLWSHQNLGDAFGSVSATLPSHGSRLLHITPRDTEGPSLPVNVHGTASTPTSVSLAWDQSTGQRVTGYDVFTGPKKVASTHGTSVTVNGLTPATGYDFTVVANGNGGRHSLPAKPVSVTTPGATGAVGYEAEAPGNTLAGGANIYGCGGCSGGHKVGFIGGGGSFTMNNIMAPTAGTYLMQLSYVDGDSSRVAILTVNGAPFQVTTSGTNDNNWDTAQTVTVPVYLNAGSNAIQFGNPNGEVADIDKVTV